MKMTISARAPKIPPTIAPVLEPFCDAPMLPAEVWSVVEGRAVVSPMPMNGSPAVAVAPAGRDVGRALPLESVDTVSREREPPEELALPVLPALDPP